MERGTVLRDANAGPKKSDRSMPFRNVRVGKSLDSERTKDRLAADRLAGNPVMIPVQA